MTFALPYCAYYCEENVWQALITLEKTWPCTAACWILGAHGQVALWQQRLALAPTAAVVWDYHVIALARARDDQPWAVFDSDSRLPLATPVDVYLRSTFPRGSQLPANVAPRFRWIDGREYRRRFFSDRAHMRNRDGSWQAPPPAWSPIQSTASDATTVDELRQADHPILGPALTFESLLAQVDVSGR